MAENECMVSVLCTAYNHEKYIAQTLQCIVDQQTDFAFELLVNDDASTDGTAAIIRSFEEKYPHIIQAFYQEKNLYSQGIDAYHHFLYREALGKYVAICEGDDFWCDPSKLQRQVDFMEAHPEYSACVHNTVCQYCRESRPDHPLLNRTGDSNVEFGDILPGMSKAYHTSSLLARKGIISNPPDFYFVGWKHGFTDYPDALWLRLNGPIRYIDRCMSVYRINSNPEAWSSGVDGRYDKLKRFLTGELDVLHTFRSHAPEAIRPLVESAERQREFDLLQIEGRDAEQRRPPYRDILKAKPFSYRLNNFLKCTMPHPHRLYRKMRGYGE